MDKISLIDFCETSTDEQNELLVKIEEAGEKENELLNKIDGVESSVKSGVAYSVGRIKTVCEDKDNARVISMNPRMELKKVRAQIADYLKKAVKLGMGNVDFIQESYEHYVGKPIPKK